VNQFVRIQTVGVNDYVAQSFPEREFDGVFLTRDAVRSFDDRIKRSSNGEWP
jgi:hypothetical protein